nr:flagellar basal body rod protein FlgB [uncultured Cellulosilyticum sp.]
MDLFANIDLMNRALDATLLKKSVISENISNVDTPNYKRKDVSFETILQKEVNANKNISNLDLNKIEPKVYVDEKSSSYRMDGNNVDIDVEMAEEAKVYARYNALITRVNAQLNRFTTVLQNIK